MKPATTMQGVYLIHFHAPYKHAEHYVGYANDIYKRLTQHRAGAGANLIRVAQEAGITWTLARVWAGATRAKERTIKGTSGKAYCPICQAYHNIPPIRSKKLQEFIS